MISEMKNCQPSRQGCQPVLKAFIQAQTLLACGQQEMVQNEGVGNE